MATSHEEEKATRNDRLFALPLAVWTRIKHFRRPVLLSILLAALSLAIYRFYNFHANSSLYQTPSYQPPELLPRHALTVNYQPPVHLQRTTKAAPTLSTRDTLVPCTDGAEIPGGLNVWCETAANCSSTVDLPYLRINSSSFDRCSQQKSCTKKLILGWTADKWTEKGNYLGKCPQWECEVSENRSRADDADAVVFHIRDHAYSQGDPPPAKRNPRQRYVFYLHESPSYLFMTFNKKLHDDFFNWTMTYRLDSDVPDPYGVIARFRHPRDDFDVDAIIDKKSLFAVQFVSNCNTDSQREFLTAELKRYIDVDVRGHCSHVKCGNTWSPVNDECQRGLEKYRFYMAFENSVCDGYVTEKFFRYVQYNVVPVVLNGANYKRIAPRGSYIAADDFENAKALAHYLTYLAGNRTAYGEYLTWHRYYASMTLNSLSFSDFRDFWGFCALCAKLWNEDDEPITSSYANIGAWWIEQGKCKPGFASTLL